MKNQGPILLKTDTRTIIVNSRALPRLWERLSTNQSFGGSADEPTRMNAAIVMIFLLHELGHLYFHDDGSYTRPEATTPSDFFLPVERIANREVRADRFAVDRLLGYTEGSGAVCMEKFFGYAPELAVRDARLTVRAAASIFDITQDPFGVFDGNPKPLLFQKNSYSHPDLDLRFMSIDALLFPEYGSLKRLTDIGVVHQPK